MNALIPNDLPVEISRLGLRIKGDISFEQWTSVGENIGRIARTSLFWVGDWLNYGQDRWNGGKRFERMPDDQREKYDHAMRTTGLELSTLQVASTVARKIAIEDRSTELTFAHHRLIARIPEEDKRRDWIRKSQDKKLSTRRLRLSINADRIVPEHEMTRSTGRGIQTHLLWIGRLNRWWAKKRVSAKYEDMPREEIESVLRDFEPVIAMIDDLQRKAESARAYLDE